MPWTFPNLEHKRLGQRDIRKLGTTRGVEAAGAAVSARLKSPSEKKLKRTSTPLQKKNTGSLMV